MLGYDPSVPLPPDYAMDLALAAFGAIFAWGVIDGIMYALLGMFERGEKHRLLVRIQNAGSDQSASPPSPRSLISASSRSPRRGSAMRCMPTCWTICTTADPSPYALARMT